MKKFLSFMKNNKIIQFLGYLSLVIFPLYCLFILDYFNFYQYDKLETVIKFWNNHPLSVLFEVIVIYVLFIIVLLLSRKAAIATGIFGVLSFVCAYVNYVKVMQNGDNFFPRDILMLGNAGEIASFVSCPLPRWFYVGIVILVIWVAFYALAKTEIPLKWFIRCPAALAIIVIVCCMFSTNKKSEKIVGAFDMSFVDTVLQSSNYKANGFVGAFTLNVLSMNVEEPDNYSKSTMTELLSDYSETPMDEDAVMYDIILVLSESFSDLRSLENVTYSENPMPNYDRIIASENCYSGNIYTTALGGGTVRPEFNILTGLTTDVLPSGASPYEYVTSDIDTFVTNYKSEGYKTMALHLYDKSFYSRNAAYQYVGIDDYYGVEDMFGLVDFTYKHGHPSDETTFEAIKYLMDSSEEPTFLFAITIENHQPYNALSEENIVIDVSSDVLTESELTSLTTYTQGVYDADKMLGELADYIDSRERPTILILYGDHYPSLGTNFSVMEKGGLFNFSDTSTENCLTMYSTPFVIYSNRQLDSGIFSSHTDNNISAYNLLNAVAVSTGFKRTAYMNALLDFYSVTPMYNPRLNLDVTDEMSRFIDIMEYVTYDQLVGKRYSAVNW